MTYTDLEFLTIHLGNATAGNTFTVESTHGTVANVAETVIDSGTGADHFNVETIAGKTTIDGGDGADTFRVGTATGPGRQRRHLDAERHPRQLALPARRGEHDRRRHARDPRRRRRRGGRRRGPADAPRP